MLTRIIVGDINHFIVEVRWVKSQSNHGAWAAMLLSRKSCVLLTAIAFSLVVNARFNNWYQSQGHEFDY